MSVLETDTAKTLFMHQYLVLGLVSALTELMPALPQALDKHLSGFTPDNPAKTEALQGAQTLVKALFMADPHSADQT